MQWNRWLSIEFIPVPMSVSTPYHAQHPASTPHPEEISRKGGFNALKQTVQRAAALWRCWLGQSWRVARG